MMSDVKILLLHVLLLLIIILFLFNFDPRTIFILIARSNLLYKFQEQYVTKIGIITLNECHIMREINLVSILLAVIMIEGRWKRIREEYWVHR